MWPKLKKKKDTPLEFIDLAAQQRRIRPQIDTAIQKVLQHGHYIMGPEVAQLEQALSAFCGAKHTISCANGTDALGMVLLAKDVKAGDAVFVPSFTFAATAEVVAWMGAEPVFIDVLPDTFTMDPESLKQGIQVAKKRGLKPTAVIPVDLFGQPADYTALEDIAAENGLWILADAAQSFGATDQGRSVGTLGLATATSFFPAKPLGCYGDGGAIFTDDDDLAETLRSLRVHGKGTDKYDNIRIGVNGRLDTLQAAILLEKLKIFPDEIRARQHIADFYTEKLKEKFETPAVRKGSTSVWAQYTLKLENTEKRQALVSHLKQTGIPTVIYYPKPLHQQTAYLTFLRAEPDLPISTHLAQVVLSLPMHPYLDDPTLEFITDAVLRS